MDTSINKQKIKILAQSKKLLNGQTLVWLHPSTNDQAVVNISVENLNNSLSSLGVSGKKKWYVRYDTKKTFHAECRQEQFEQRLPLFNQEEMLSKKPYKSIQNTRERPPYIYNNHIHQPFIHNLF